MRYDGTNGADLFKGTAGNDTMYGNGGNDNLKGGAGADYLNGGAGNDMLIGGTGYDFMLGGAGKDTFRFFANDSLDGDLIMDFQVGDKISFIGISPKTVWQEINSSGDVEVHYGSLGSITNTITLEGVHAPLGFGDFTFG